MKRCAAAVFVILCGLCAATIVFAKPGVVKTKDGQTYSGEIDETNPDAITVKTASGIPTAVPRDRVASIELAEDFEKKFRDRMSKLDPKDVPGRLKLAREAYENRQYVLARDAAEQARLIDPNNAEAADLVNSIQSQIRLERMQQQAAANAGGAGRDTTGGGAAVGGSGEVTTTQPMSERLLKADQINDIRQAELRPDDAGVRVRFERDVKRRFMDYTGRTPQEINAMSVNQLVQEIIRKGTPEMRRDVIIQNDPPAMMEFRRSVHPFVINNCATSGCHGGINPAKFSLITPGDSDPVVYTNFYTLGHYIKKVPSSGDNVFGHGELRMIDRQAPTQSLILQYGLPAAISEYDHPEVQNYRAPYRGVNDARYQQILRWVGESLVPVPPDYGFTFGPTAAAASQPATDVAPQPPPPTRPVSPPRPPAAQPRGGGGTGAGGPPPTGPRPLQPTR